MEEQVLQLSEGLQTDWASKKEVSGPIAISKCLAWELVNQVSISNALLL
jgi:hypothetical protein